MSIGNSAGISFAGIGSGIDTDSIVRRLMELENIPVTRLQRRQDSLKTKMNLYSEFRTQLNAVKSAAQSLNAAGAFNPMTATSSVTDVATISAGSASSAGTYSLSVYQLAQTQKLSSVAQTDLTTALGLTGTFQINGKDITVASTDSLTAVRDKINNAGGDFTASIINGGTGQAHLTLTSKNSGLTNNLKIKDTTGTVLQTLGFTSTAIRNAVVDGAKSYGASSATAKLTDMAGFSGTGAFSVTINGATIAVDMATETLTTLRDKINGSAAGVTASIVSATENGRTVHRLQVVGSGSTPTFGSEQNFFTDLGILKRTSELVSAQNAEFTLDGIALSNAKNEITDAIPGATLTLKKANSTTPETSVLTMNRDDDGVVRSVKSMVDAFNGFLDFVKKYSAFDKETFASGPLFGDATTQDAVANLSATLFQDVVGGATGYSNLALAGVTSDNEGKLVLNEATLKTALQANPNALATMFKTTGSASGADLTFITNTSKSQGVAGSYSVNITQVATKQVTTAANTATTLAQNERLTFSGAAFGTNVNIDFGAGTSLASVITQINSNTQLKDRVVASDVGGKLVLTSLKFGATGQFTVVSDVDAGSGGTGIGTAGQALTTAGLDVAGTIDGVAATGSGQFLTGNDVTGNRANGVQIQYTGTATGAVGTVSLTKGIAAKLSDRLEGYLDSVSGLLTNQDKALQSQYDDFGESITQLQAQLTRKEERLRRQYLAMEQAVSRAQQQQQRLSAMLPR